MTAGPQPTGAPPPTPGGAPQPAPAGERVTWLTDETGKSSSMRLLSAIALATAVALAFLDLFAVGEVDSEIILYFLIAAFAPKAVQKFAERR